MRRFTLHASGKFALFTEPMSKRGGEKTSYPVPTYSALQGMVENVYRKPTFDVVIDRVRVMNEICMQSVALKPIDVLNTRNTLAYYHYLVDVNYQVEFHIEWSIREDLVEDRVFSKHEAIMERMIDRGGRRNPYLGTSECIATIEPGAFGAGDGYYDNSGDIDFGRMVHGIDYPERTGTKTLMLRDWDCIMRNGIITFPRPSNTSKRSLR